MYKFFFVSLILIFLISIDIVLAQEYSINAVEYPKEILIESGWTNYFNVVVKNTGDMNLNNVTIYFEGEFPKWFGVLTNKTDVLQPDANSSFMAKLSVPSDVESGSYSFILYSKSKEITSSNTFAVRVFGSKKDSMLYQVQELELEIEYIKMNATKVENSGKNVTGILSTLDEAKGYIDDSKNYINNGEYDQATELMKEIENLIKKATFDLSIAPPKISISITQTYSFPYEVLIVLPLVAVVALGFYVVKLRGRAFVKPSASIKSALVGEKKSTSLEAELSEAENSRKLVEDEFKENLISKESYDELIEKYEKVISDLKQEIERKKTLQ